MAHKPLHYKRSRFSTRLPADRLYTPSHYWLRHTEEGPWQVGFTKFATRMLGEIVEIDFEVAMLQSVKRGDAVGWLEGFKAVSDLYAPFEGRFAGGNQLLGERIELVGKDPYGRGWLYLLEGEVGDDCLDIYGYERVLNETIDRITGKSGSAEGTGSTGKG